MPYEAPVNYSQAFADGGAAAQAVTDTWRKNQAFNALSKIYGPLTGDPELATKLQAYDTATKLDPLKIENAGLVNTGKAQDNAFAAADNPLKLTGDQLSNEGAANTNAFNTAANPLRLQGLQLGNDETGQKIDQGAQAFPLEQQGRRAEIASRNASTANTQAETAVRGEQLTQAKAAADRQAATGILANLKSVAEAGGDVGAAFDHSAPLIAQLEGVDPSHMAPLRQAIVSDPTTIDRLSAALAAAPGVGAKPAAAAKAGAVVDPAAQVSALHVTQSRISNVIPTIDRMSQLLGQMHPSAIVRGIRQQTPGTPEYQFVQLAHQLGANLSLSDLMAAKANGLSLGRITNTEFQAAAHALLNADLGQDPTTIAAGLSNSRGLFTRLNEDIGDSIKKLQPAGTKAETSKFTTGKLYVDGNGNRATWDGKQFVPAK